MAMTIDEIINHYDGIVRVIDVKANKQKEMSYGGMIREVKGLMQEFITEQPVMLAWDELGGDENRLEINSKKIHIPIQDNYIENLKNDEVKKYIQEHKAEYYYGLSVDKHVFIDGEFVMGIECKAYTENAMIKRILVDFHLLKTVYPNISCHLFQLESQLGGDYSKLPDVVYGAKSTHSIMSYFGNVDLHITTLLEGERDINNPIHKHFKPLKREVLEKAVEMLKEFLGKYVNGIRAVR